MPCGIFYFKALNLVETRIIVHNEHDYLHVLRKVPHEYALMIFLFLANS